MPRSDLRITWYGDDFTGSTDAMEALTRAGVPAALFLDVPEQAELAAYPELRAIGVAGNTRAMDPEQMEHVLTPALTGLKALGAPICHYKVCSTFDSSPEIGSIGRAIDIGQSVFESTCVPVVVGVPVLGRYVVFGNLFARSGRESEIYRLDRHPTMRYHPVTPMEESDLRQHLGSQTARSVSLFDIVDLRSPNVASRLTSLLQQRPDVVLFDTLEESDLPALGHLIDQMSSREEQLFTVGSSGIEYALTAHWRLNGAIPEPVSMSPPAPVDQVIVVSGSCSPVTARQIAQALKRGFAGIALNPDRLLDEERRDSEIDRAVAAAREPLSNDRSVILHSCLGPDDQRISLANRQLAAMGWSTLESRLGSGAILGRALGMILRELLDAHPVQRAIVAGGDTSYHVASALGIRSLRMIAPTAPGSPLCRATAPGSPVDGLEITFKGGQVGSIGFFEDVRLGAPG